MHKLAVIAAAILMMGGIAAAGPTINSDFEFKPSGRLPYACQLPNGTTTTCNQWVFSRGWKHVQVAKNQSTFAQLTSVDGQRVNLVRPRSGFGALYDANWSDVRNFDFLDILENEMRWQAEFDELVLRELTPATVEQVVNIKKAGNYNLRSCMAAKMYVQMIDLDPPLEGGISVVLERENPSGIPTELAAIPDKAMYGIGSAFERDSVGITWVDSVSQIPSTHRRDVYGIRESRVSLVDDGNGIDYIASSEYSLRGTWVDSHQGHAGLRTAYRYHTNRDNTTAAIWTCHEKTVALSPGMHRIKAIANPIVLDYPIVLGGRISTYTDHDGIGAISRIILKKVR